MSDPRSLSIARGLELLEQLNLTLTEFTKAEAEQTRRAREQLWTLQREKTEAATRLDDQAARQTADEEASFTAAKDRAVSIHTHRRDRIDRLTREGVRTLPRRAQDERERWVGALQMREFLTTRRLDSERETADAKFAETSAGIEAHASRLGELQRRARNHFTGYISYLWMLRTQPSKAVQPEVGIERRLDAIESDLAEFRKFILPKIFSFAPVPALIAVLGITAFVLTRQTGLSTPVWVAAGVVAVAILAIHFAGRSRSRSLASKIAEEISLAKADIQRLRENALAVRKQAEDAITVQRAAMDDEINRKWERSEEVKAAFEARERDRLSRVPPRALARNDRLLATRLAQIERAHATRIREIEALTDTDRQQFEKEFGEKSTALEQEIEAAQLDLRQRWDAAITPLFQSVQEMNTTAAALFPDWTLDYVHSWEPRREFLPVTKFGHLDVDLPAPSSLPLPTGPQASIPLALAYPDYGSILFESREPLTDGLASCLNQIILRLLATTPPGKLAFTIFDPVGLGRNFAGLMHLADYEENLISRRIWTQSEQIEERLAELSQHIEKVIQMYLRDEYPTIVEYNAQAGSTAEKFHFLVISDFPANFSETALRRLQSILASGPRCGVHTLIHWDRRHPLPAGIDENELRAHSVCIEGGRTGLILETAREAANARLVLDAAPPPDLALAFIERVGAASIDSNVVQVPFDQIAPAHDELWKGDTTAELRVAIGRSGATKQQMLAIGKGTRQHALVAGKTGSGKSTLFHVIITNLALSCSPQQVEFYLIDFKKGVEFKCYATKRLPHARVVAIESDREFGLSVLQRVDDELRHRGDLFRKLGVQDVSGYKRESGQPMPRTLLLIDEFQELFVEDDSIAQAASVLLDRIVRQGRAFGIHVILGSQTLGGAYSLARTTLGQMVIRIALQCNEADALLIMDDNNPAPRLLSRPGEGIYNDSAGAIEGNSPFQVCWLPDDERDRKLDLVRELAGRNPDMDSTPIVFEGNAPADIAGNELLAKALKASPATRPSRPRAWLGAPNSIKEPTEISLPRQSGAHLLIIGQRDETALVMLGASLLALSAQYPEKTARFILLHQTPPDTAEAEILTRIEAAARHEVVMGGVPEMTEILADLSAELHRRLDGDAAGPDVFLLVHGLQRFRKLRAEDEFDFSMSEDATAKPSAQFAELVTEGAAVGIHILASIDTFASVNRFLNRKALAEFGLRVLFQMSANDSASLIDSPKAGDLGLHRAILFDEHAGTLETFRPYAMPDVRWLEDAAKRPAGGTSLDPSPGQT